MLIPDRFLPRFGRSIVAEDNLVANQTRICSVVFEIRMLSRRLRA
jgi:hypothetical protein